MGPIRRQIRVDAPRERVFELLADLARRPAFAAPYQQEFRLERIDSTGVGAAARFRTPPGETWMATQVEELQPPYRILERGWTGRSNRVPVTTAWELVEAPGGMTEITLIFFTEPDRLADRLREILGRATRAHKRGWDASLRRLRELLEGEGPAPRVRVAGGNRHRTGIA